jgi:DNA-binding MarR family transcriptional regulator
MRIIMPRQTTDVELIARAVMQLGRRLRAERPEGSVSLSAVALLATLHRRGPMPAARLAEAEGLRPQSLSRLLTAMFEAGLIARETDEADRRNLVIHLTTEGKRALKADMVARRRWLEAVMAERLSAEEREQLRDAAELMLRLADLPRATKRASAMPALDFD